MNNKYFNNIDGYPEGGLTKAIPDAARSDCRQAWMFAREHGHPMNRHVHIGIPDHISQEYRRNAYRYYLQKLRTFASDQGFMCVMLMVRDCNPETNNDPTIDILIHVPDQHQARFKRVVEGWKFEPKVKAVDYVETTDPDGLVRSIFNDLFSATSDQFKLSHPKLPHMISGEVMGKRTFFSKHLWTKKQIEFRRRKAKALNWE